MQHRHTKGLTQRVAMGQSRKTQVIAMSRSKLLRLVAGTHAYRIQIRLVSLYPTWNPGAYSWSNIQKVPRTKQREDIGHEWRCAMAAFNRRVQEVAAMEAQHGADLFKGLDDLRHQPELIMPTIRHFTKIKARQDELLRRMANKIADDQYKAFIGAPAGGRMYLGLSRNDGENNTCLST